MTSRNQRQEQVVDTDSNVSSADLYFLLLYKQKQKCIASINQYVIADHILTKTSA